MSNREKRKSELSVDKMSRIKGSILNKDGPSPNERFAGTGDECEFLSFTAGTKRGIDIFQAIAPADTAQGAHEEPAADRSIALFGNGRAMMDRRATFKRLGVEAGKGDNLFGCA